MDVANPMLDVVPGVRGAVLATLARIDGPVTGRYLARAAGQAQSSTARVLDDLVAAGVVHCTVLGRDNTYQLNREHVAAPAIIALAGLRGELVRRFQAILSVHPNVIAAWLFGSAARGDGGRSSDLDILVVHDGSSDPGALVNELATHGQGWTGNPVQVVEHSTVTFAHLVTDKNPLISAIKRDGMALTDASHTLLARVDV